MKRLLCLLCFTILPCFATAHPREMILAGGAMKLCSSLSASACKGSDKIFANARQSARYQMTPDSISLALSPMFWSSREDAPSSFEMMQMISGSAKKAKDKIVSADALSDIFSQVCTINKKIDMCQLAGAKRTWDKLLDDERGYVLSAFELPERIGDKRRREVANILDSKNPHGFRILQAFVAAAAKRSPNKRPRILFVTAAGADPYDAVDFYISAFRQAGAEPVWWPIDSALEASLSDPAKCNALLKYRVTALSLANREAVFPDLTSIQKLGCENADALSQFPSQAQGIFLGGGDQWRLRKVFFDENDQPNIWLRNLTTAFNNGSLVVGGTSAGTAVQSSSAMLTGGTSDAAISLGVKNLEPPPEGCERALRCPGTLPEDAVTYWPAGGLGLVEGFVMDTHFSERARPLRLLKLLADTHAGAGLGVDETSALHLTWEKQQIQVETLGASGAWWFEPPDSRNQTITARAHYLVPGRRFIWENAKLHSTDKTGPTLLPTKAFAPLSDTNALNDNVVRNAAQRLAQEDSPSITLQASNYVLKLSKMPPVATWVGPDNQVGISGLEIEIAIDKP